MTEGKKRPVQLNLEVKIEGFEDIGGSRYKLTLSASGSVDNPLEHSITVNGLKVCTGTTGSEIFEADKDKIIISGLDKKIPPGTSWPIDHFPFEMETMALPLEQVKRLIGDAKNVFCREDATIYLYHIPEVPNEYLSEVYPAWPNSEDRGIWLMNQQPEGQAPPITQAQPWRIYLEDIHLEDYPEMATLDSWLCDPPTFLPSVTQYVVEFDWVERPTTTGHTTSQNNTACLCVQFTRSAFTHQEHAEQYASEAFKCAVEAYHRKPTDPFMK